jgi:hypothetical protein
MTEPAAPLAPPAKSPPMTDIRSGDWADRYAPARLVPYIRLARLDRPIGTWLLLFPGWWAIALAARRWPDWRLMALFAIGAIVMPASSARGTAPCQAARSACRRRLPSSCFNSSSARPCC